VDDFPGFPRDPGSERRVRGYAEHVRRERAVHDDRGGRAGVARIEIATGQDPRAVRPQQVDIDLERRNLWRAAVALLRVPGNSIRRFGPNPGTADKNVTAVTPGSSRSRAISVSRRLRTCWRSAAASSLTCMLATTNCSTAMVGP
jgi:hypothetical protein